MDLNPVPIPLLGATFGVILVGAILSAILFGILNLQSIWYFKQYPNDWWFYRAAEFIEQVAVIWVLDTLDVAVSTHALYFLLVETRIVGKFLALDQLDIIWSCKLHVLLETFIKVAVQAIYAVRLWKGRLLALRFGSSLTPADGQSDNIFIWVESYPGFLPSSRLVMSLLSFCFYDLPFTSIGAGMYLVYGAYSISTFSDIPTIKNEIIAVFSTTTAVDFIISITTCHYLNRSRAASMFPNTIAMLVALMRLILISGLVMSICSTVILITFLIWPNTLIFVGIDLLQPRLYINSLLAMCVPNAVIHELWGLTRVYRLNARKELRSIQRSEFLELKGES
ncbi:uncharacterized protein EV420DRAFT_1644158 [Desarmillaria tabescens]|uniref:DUF6534 domain-containing protein n=1 Tax=Armillaria tabescens TaxID=1929756 RepID=A0AA39K9R3_ARMTA|nr:uncharacterized protein EV420DRAFT_1644158 [Desarmillaria tabescens]KAK0457002.1 hypothetical protein EV420DRAFT_1644158 [Desarmillaria tabescens]